MTAEALAGGDRAREIARDLRVVAAQLDAAWQLAREVSQSHSPGHTRSCRLCQALVDCETSGLWTPEEGTTT